LTSLSSSYPNRNVLQINGSFSNSPISLNITGFKSPTGPPQDYSTLISFDSSGPLDATKEEIVFGLQCSLPCKTCDITSFTENICTTCDSNYLLFNDTCVQSCPSGYKSNGQKCLDIAAQSMTSS
jgi:hypothetical protein